MKSSLWLLALCVVMLTGGCQTVPSQTANRLEIDRFQCSYDPEREVIALAARCINVGDSPVLVRAPGHLRFEIAGSNYEQRPPMPDTPVTDDVVFSRGMAWGPAGPIVYEHLLPASQAQPVPCSCQSSVDHMDLNREVSISREELAALGDTSGVRFTLIHELEALVYVEDSPAGPCWVRTAEQVRQTCHISLPARSP